MIVTVQELGQSKGGKPKCKAGGKWYFLPTDKDTGHGNSPTLGQVIEIEEGKPFGDDGQFLTIARWRPAGNVGQTAGASNRAMPSVSTQTGDVHQAFIGQGFISNVVGQAIVAGLIKSPGQILDWYNAAKLALEGKKAAVPFSDALPERMSPSEYAPPGIDADYDGGKW